jgi:hypothetical protein
VTAISRMCPGADATLVEHHLVPINTIFATIQLAE